MTASSKASTIYLASSIVKHIGGWILNVLPYAPPLPKSKCLSLVSYIKSLVVSFAGSWVCLFFTISTPIIKPFPLTSPMMSYFYFKLPNSLSKYEPTFSALRWRFSFLIVFKTSIPTRHCKCPPPNVLKNTALYAYMIYFLATTPAIGKPLPIPLAIVMISGLKPAHLCPQNFSPTLPKPV